MFASYGVLAPVLYGYEFNGSQLHSHVPPGKYVSLRTMGDGACAVHAVLGEIRETSNVAYVVHENPRGWVRSTLKASESVEDCESTLKDHVGELEAKRMMERALTEVQELLKELLKPIPSDEAVCLCDRIFDNNDE